MLLTDSLRGKNVVVIGATKGIGRATSLLLSEHGANLFMGARTLGVLAKHPYGIGEGEFFFESVDITDEDSVSSFYDSVVATFGTVDVLINSAGYGTFSSFLDMTTEDFDRMLDVNLRGSFLTSKYFARHMVSNGRGRIVNINSIAGSLTLSNSAGYSSSKYGLLGLSRVMQQELRSKGVYVTSILPGSVDSPFWEGIKNPPERSKMIPLTTIAQHVAFILSQPDGAVVDEIMITPPLGVL